MFMEGHKALERETEVIVEEAVLPPSKDGLTCLVVTNLLGLMRTISSGTSLRTVQTVDMLSPENQSKVTDRDAVGVRKPSPSEEERRKKKLLEELQLEVPTLEIPQLSEFHMQNHMVFSLKEGEHGETDIVTMSINTGDAHPSGQAPRHMPFIVSQEVVKQLQDMQRDGIIQPSSSSPVVMVRKDSSHRF